MDDLYQIMSDLLEIEHQQAALLYTLDILDSDYRIRKHEELSLLLCLCKTCLLTTKHFTKESVRALDNTLLQLKNS